jgi:AraC-like DNA-binding protein
MIDNWSDIRVGRSNLKDLTGRMTKATHSFFFVVIGGNAVIDIDLRQYQLSQDMLCVIFPGRIFKIIDASPDFDAIYIQFSDLTFRFSLGKLSPSFFYLLKECPVREIKTSNSKTIHLFQIINDYYNDEESSFLPAIIDNLIQCALYDIYDNFVVKQQLISLSRQEELFMTFINLIHEHCRKERSVAFYANKMHITPRYLSRIVAGITGLQTKELIDRHVILEIQVQLESTTSPVKEIASILNFPNQSFLGSYFKRFTGVSLEQYRAKFLMRE